LKKKRIGYTIIKTFKKLGALTKMNFLNEIVINNDCNDDSNDSIENIILSNIKQMLLLQDKNKCPISMSDMNDDAVIISSSGMTYSKKMIDNYISNEEKTSDMTMFNDPLTRDKFSKKNIVRNYAFSDALNNNNDIVANNILLLFKLFKNKIVNNDEIINNLFELNVMKSQQLIEYIIKNDIFELFSKTNKKVFSFDMIGVAVDCFNNNKINVKEANNFINNILKCKAINMIYDDLDLLDFKKTVNFILQNKIENNLLVSFAFDAASNSKKLELKYTLHEILCYAMDKFGLNLLHDDDSKSSIDKTLELFHIFCVNCELYINKKLCIYCKIVNNKKVEDLGNIINTIKEVIINNITSVPKEEKLKVDFLLKFYKSMQKDITSKVKIIKNIHKNADNCIANSDNNISIMLKIYRHEFMMCNDNDVISEIEDIIASYMDDMLTREAIHCLTYIYNLYEIKKYKNNQNTRNISKKFEKKLLLLIYNHPTKFMENNGLVLLKTLYSMCRKYRKGIYDIINKICDNGDIIDVFIENGGIKFLVSISAHTGTENIISKLFDKSKEKFINNGGWNLLTLNKNPQQKNDIMNNLLSSHNITIKV
jgi:hypothetical protein